MGIKRADSFMNISRKSRVGLGTIPLWKGEEIKTIEIPRIARGGNNAGVKLPISFDSEIFMEFLGWFLSEGCVIKRPVNYSYRIVIYQSPSVHREGYEEIYNVVKKMGFSPQRRKDGVSFQSKDLSEYLLRFGKDCYTKKIIPEIKNLSKHLLAKMLTSLIKGDGRKNNSGGGFTYASVSKTLADDVQEIALKCGYRSTLVKEKRKPECIILGRKYSQVDIYLVGINRPSPICYASPNIVKYTGNIVCVTAEDNNIILVRRNGRAIWAGNCKSFNEATAFYFDPKQFLYSIYKPKPWKIISNVWNSNGNIEIVLEKISEETGNEIFEQMQKEREKQGTKYGN